MKTVIAGSRKIKDKDLVYKTIEDAIDDGFTIEEVVSGTAEGVKYLGVL